MSDVIVYDNITGVMQDVLPIRTAPSLRSMARVRRAKHHPRAERRSGRSEGVEITMTSGRKLVHVYGPSRLLTAASQYKQRNNKVNMSYSGSERVVGAKELLAGFKVLAFET